jgi:hypothetical protein
LSGFLQDQKPAATAAPRRNPEPALPAALHKAAPAASDVDAVPVGAPVKAPRSGESPLARNVLYLAGASGVVLLVLSVFLTVKAKR